MVHNRGSWAVLKFKSGSRLFYKLADIQDVFSSTTKKPFEKYGEVERHFPRKEGTRLDQQPFKTYSDASLSGATYNEERKNEVSIWGT